MIPYHRIAGQFYNRPLLIAPDAARTISAFLLSRIDARRGDGMIESGAETIQAFRPTEGADGSREYHSPRTSRFYGSVPLADDGTGRPLPYRRTPEGVAIITLIGEFVNRGAWVGASSGLISYEGLKYQAAIAAGDQKTKAAILDIESPGGEAVGAFEAAAAVRQLAARKPVVAVANGMACSAAYAIASGASRIVTIPTGFSGSIGVVMLHLDFSKFLENEGVEPTLIFAGDHKIDGNPYEPLPEAVRQDMKREVTGFYDLFIETVAAGRQGLTAKAIRATQARVYTGQDAVKAGLADEIGTFEEVLAALSIDPARASQGRSTVIGKNGGRSIMTDTDKPEATAAAPAGPATPATDSTTAAAAATPAVAAASANPAGTTSPVIAAPPAAPPLATAPVPALTAEECAELATIGASATRLGVAVDIAAAIRQGTNPDALRREVLDAAAARDRATATIATAPITGETGPAGLGPSPIVARAKATAAKHQKT